MKVLSAFGKWIRFIITWLWVRPTTPEPRKPDHIKATDLNIQNAFVVIDYKGQLINLRKHEVAMFHSMSRKDKRAMAAKFAKAQAKGEIIFQEINGQKVAIKNKNYGGYKEDIRQ